MMRKYLPLLLYIPLVLLAIVSLVIFYWNVQPVTVIDAKNTPYPVRPSVADPGGVEIVTADYCKLQSVDGTVVIRYVGRKSIVRSPDLPERAGKGCYKQDIPMLLPAQLANDTYYLEFNATYRLNPLTTVTETSRSQEFTVR